MKKVVFAAAVAACIVGAFLSSCTKQAPSAEALCGEWYIGAYRNNGSGSMQNIADSRYSAAFTEDSTFFCATDCNSLHSTCLVNGDSLRFGPVASTRMACPDMEVEQNIGALLNDVRTFTIQDTTLCLKDNRQQTLIILYRIQNGSN